MKLVTLCVGLLCLLLSVGAEAAQPTEADRATARALALEGNAALQKKDYATAADRFRRADALVHAPTLVVDWARALHGLGRFVEAHEKYELVLREGVDASAPKSWQRALADAKKELEALKPRLAWITVVLREPHEASVKIDGAPVPAAALGVKRAADPGFPEVTVDAFGYESFKQTVTVGPGEEKLLEVTLQKLPDAPRLAPDTSNAYRPRQRSNTRRTLSYVAFGVGGAALVTGGVFGGLAYKKHGDLDDECIDGKCPSSSAKKRDTYYLYATTSTIGVAVGAAGLGAGLVLLLTEPKTTETAGGRLRVRPLIGLGVLGAQGSFQ